MPGSKDANLRKGDVQEELGVLLLKAFALVVPVPRPEDVGTDALATLLRPATSRRLIPEDSFFIQLKASSVRVIHYDTPDSVNWLVQLALPFFIGSVDLSKASIELYASHKLAFTLMQPVPGELHVHLDPPVGVSKRQAEKILDVRLGHNPVLAWSMRDLADPTFHAHAYNVLKPHILTAQRNIVLRPIRHFEGLDWETGKPPQRDGVATIRDAWTGNPEILKALEPAIRALATDLVARKRFDLLPTVAEFVSMMRELGARFRPINSFVAGALKLADPEDLKSVDLERLRSHGVDVSGYGKPEDI